MKRLYLGIGVAMMALSLAACGGSSATGAGNTTGTPNTSLSGVTSVKGTVLAPNGTSPIAGATVYIPATSTGKALGSPQIKVKALNKSLTGDDGTTCDDTPEAACASTCSGADGSFTLDLSGADGCGTSLVMIKGLLSSTIALSCPTGECVLPSTSTTFSATGGASSSVPKIAVVTGYYDAMQDVLAKLGFGTVTEDGHLDTTASFSFTLIDGSSSLDDATYSNFDSYLNGDKALSDFDIIFINCGNAYEGLADDPDVVARLQDFVNNGGRIYATDWAYNFVEQSFPDFMYYYGDPIDPDVPGTLSSAKVGSGGISGDMTVTDTTMSSWLSNVSVNSNDGTTAGNPEDCDYSLSTFPQATSALNSGLIPIGDFLGGWVLMNGVTDTDPATVWIHSGSVSITGLTSRPLTASKTIGVSGGQIAYSSYHTAESCPSTGFWPQERVLEYLVFETL